MKKKDLELPSAKEVNAGWNKFKKDRKGMDTFFNPHTKRKVKR